MALSGFALGDLYAEKPIVQGGMGVGISLSRLAGAVAAEGGIGVISAAHPGFMEPDFWQNTEEANLRGLTKHIRAAKEAAPHGIVGVNIMCAMNGYEKFVRCAAKAGADLIISGAGLPAELPELVEGSSIKIAPIVSPPKAAKVLLALWDRRYHRTADMVVIEGPLAGGHLGYSVEEVNALKTTGYDQQILEVLEIVKQYEDKYGRKIPVVFGGGVFSNADIRHYLSLGLSGVQIASRFVATEECDADIRYKQAYIDAKPEDIVLVKSPVGMPGRAINNAFIKQLAKEGRIAPTHCVRCIRKCNPASTPYCITEALIRAAKGDVDHALLFCGGEIGRIHELTNVHALLRELCGYAVPNTKAV